MMAFSQRNHACVCVHLFSHVGYYVFDALCLTLLVMYYSIVVGTSCASQLCCDVVLSFACVCGPGGMRIHDLFLCICDVHISTFVSCIFALRVRLFQSV